MRLYKDTDGIKSYATEANAEKAADKLVDQVTEARLRYVLMPAQGGRYAVCFILSQQQMWMAGGIAHLGFCVTG